MGDAERCARCGEPIPAGAPGGGCPRCMLAEGLASPGAAGADVPSVADVERLIPGFEILAVVGHGGMGVVYKARQKALDRIVALKVLPPAAAASPGFTERFAREAKALARLQHPHIVAVHDFGQSGDAAAGALCWLVMEYVDGMNVREAMRAGRITSKEALAIVPQICDALQYAHDRGVVHRDIKPENVLIDRDGRVRVADFGLAKLASRGVADASLTGAQQVMGTVHYMAPEQWQRPKDVDHRADIYSLGVVFYEMLTGELPLGRFEPPSHKAQIDVRVDEVVLRSLERERERRWQHVSEMKTKVEEISSGPPPVAAVVAPAVTTESEDEDEGMKEAARNWPDTFPNAAITFAVAVAFGFAAYFAEPGLWWAAGAVGLGAVWQAIAAAENRAKAPRPATRAAPRVVTVPLFAPWVVALAGAAGVALAAAMVWGFPFETSQTPNHIATLAFFLGVAMAALLVGRWVIARKLDEDRRRALGTPVLLVVLSVASLGLAATGLIVSIAAARESDRGWVPSPAPRPKAPPAPQRPVYADSPWDVAFPPEFVVRSTSLAMAPPDARGMKALWARLADAVERGDSVAALELYEPEERDGLRALLDDRARVLEIADRSRSGDLGMPLLALALGKEKFAGLRFMCASVSPLTGPQEVPSVVATLDTLREEPTQSYWRCQFLGQMHEDASGTWFEWFFKRGGCSRQ